MKALRLVALVTLILATARTGFPQPLPGRPFPVFTTYWGGSMGEEVAKVAIDAAGNVYVVGTTASPNFPKTINTIPARGFSDVFVSKFNASGTLIFSTVFGGSSGDSVKGMAVDAGGNILVVGETFSTDFPVVNPIQPSFHPGGCGEFGGTCSDGFAAKVDSTGGSLIFATYLGTEGLDVASDVAVDGAGNVYVIGHTQALFANVTPIRPRSGTQDVFVGKIPPAGGSFSYFTYLGGSFDDWGNGIAVDPAGNAYLTGETSSQNFPTLNPIQALPENFSTSAFATKLDTTGVLAYSTFLTGYHTDRGVDIAVDSSGHAYVVGFTQSTNFPTAHPSQPFLRGQNDVFVAKLNPSGSSFAFSTYLGGNDREQVLDFFDFHLALNVAIDATGNVFVTGSTESADFPALSAFQPFGGGTCIRLPDFVPKPCTDAFVSKFDSNGKLVFSTPMGGNRDDRGRGVAIASDGSLYVVGTTASPNFPVKSALQPTLSGNSDIFFSKISTMPAGCLLPQPQQLSPTGGIFDPRPTFSWEAVAGAQAYLLVSLNVGQSLLTGTPPVQFLGFTASTSFTPSAPIAPGDYSWMAVGWNLVCGLGDASRGMAFTLPGTCPTPPATQVSPVGGATVNNPIRLDWSVDEPGIAALSVVVVVTSLGKFVEQHATTSNTFTLPETLSTGNYMWYVVTWNSTCGATISGPAAFRSSGSTNP